MLVKIFLYLIPFTMQAQVNLDSFYQYNPLSILNGFSTKYTPYDVYKETGSNPCPWQSFRHAGTQSISIDIVCTHKELMALKADKDVLIKDLWLMWMECAPESLETVRRGNKVWLQRPGQPIPMVAYFNILRTSEYITLPSGPYNGWHVYLAPGGLMGQGGKVPMALKELPEKNGERMYILSIALIMKSR
jgi:hypothetical protein